MGGSLASGGDADRASSARLSDTALHDYPVARALTVLKARALTGTPKNYTREASGQDQRGPKQKARDNIEAIRLIKQCALEDRFPSDEERQKIALFYGFGGLPQAFPRPNGSIVEGWEDVVPALQVVTTSEEYAAIRRSTLDAHYTADMVVESMWAGVERMGIKAHREPFRIWESSIGSGVFFALMPDALRVANPFLERIAVEMDTISATVSQVLFPEDRISNAPLQNVPLRDRMDLVIGNPPFGSQKLLDMNRRDLSRISPNTHSYFFAKSIDALNKGGIASLVVSRYLLDANREENQELRRWMHRHAELLHAVRLPRTAFSKTAFTEVVTDILVLRKRAEPLPTDTPDPDWIDGKVPLTAEHNGKPIFANGWYANREDLILGTPSLAGKMYGGSKEEEFTVLPLNDVPLTELLAERFVAQLPEDGFSQWFSGPRDRIDAGPKMPEIDRDQVGRVQPYGYFRMPEAATAELAEDFGKTQSGIRIARRLPDDFEGEFQYALVDEANAKHFPRLAGMIALRDTALELLTRQLSTEASEGELSRLRARLNQHYDQFRKEFGCLNSQANARLLRGDPGSAIVMGLERDYDKGVSADMAKKTGEKSRKPSAVKSDLFTKRTQYPVRPVEKADSAKDALFIVLAESGEVRWNRVCQLTGKSWEQVAAELGLETPSALAFENPDGRWEERSAFLSGDVKSRMEEVEQALQGEISDTRRRSLQASLEALQGVIPKPIPAELITVHPGAPYVPESMVEQFLADTGLLRPSVHFMPYNGQWQITAAGAAGSEAEKFTVVKRPLHKLVTDLFNHRTPVVYHKFPDGSREVDEESTALAIEKVKALREHWHQWLQKDPERMALLADEYNNRFNRIVQREYDGRHLVLPGAAANISLRPHQKNAVWRACQSKSILLDHKVGAGKTFAAIAGVMEKRRMGQARKPVVTVPNHLVGQWASAWVTLYPSARILVADEQDMDSKHRQEFLARAAYNDWDAVILSHSAFKLIPVDPDYYEQFVNKELAQIDDLLSNMDDLDRMTVKQVEKKRQSLTERMKTMHDRVNGKRDQGLLHFGEIGFDYVVNDESHSHKNVPYMTTLKGVSGLGNPAGSERAEDMFIKVTQARESGAGVMFLTGTPISNTIAEMYLLMRYLGPEILEQQGIYSFDSWVSTFATVNEEFAFSLTGQFKSKKILSEFNDIPSLVQQYKSFADIIGQQDIDRLLKAEGKKGVPLPKIKGGKPLIVTCPMSPEQRQIVGEEVGTNHIGEPVYAAGSILYRLDNLPSKPGKGEDNVLVIINDLKKVSLDARAFDPEAPASETGKIPTCVDNIVNIYQQWDADKGAQLVYLDFSTPKGSRGKVSPEVREILELVARVEAGEDEEASDQVRNQAEAAEEKLSKYDPMEVQEAQRMAKGLQVWSAYEKIRDQLIARGIPEKEIAFIHDANTDQRKQELFGQVRSGAVRVLIGSTGKMGPGMNVQDRLVEESDKPEMVEDVEIDVPEEDARIAMADDTPDLEEADGMDAEGTPENVQEPAEIAPEATEHKQAVPTLQPEEETPSIALEGDSGMVEAAMTQTFRSAPQRPPLRRPEPVAGTTMDLFGDLFGTEPEKPESVRIIPPESAAIPAATAPQKVSERMKTVPDRLREFISIGQTVATEFGLQGAEHAFFEAKMRYLQGIIQTMPRTHDTDGQGDTAMVYLHYFTKSADWFITELDVDTDGEGQLQAFGLADLGMGYPELGYINLKEAIRLRAELDYHFEPRSLEALKLERYPDLVHKRPDLPDDLQNGLRMLRPFMSDAQQASVESTLRAGLMTQHPMIAATREQVRWMQEDMPSPEDAAIQAGAARCRMTYVEDSIVPKRWVFVTGIDLADQKLFGAVVQRKTQDLPEEAYFTHLTMDGLQGHTLSIMTPAPFVLGDRLKSMGFALEGVEYRERQNQPEPTPAADTVLESLSVPDSLDALVSEEQWQQWENLWESGTETDRDLLRMQMNRVAQWLDAPLPVTEAERQGRDARAGIVLRSEQGTIQWFITGLNADGVSAYGMQIFDDDAILGRVDLRVALQDAPIIVIGHEPGPLLADLRATGILIESVDFADDTRAVFYRGGPSANISGITSIESIFDYERDMLENDEVTMTPDGLEYQHLAPVNTLTWAATSREEAEEYGVAREIILNDPVVLMRDGQGGVLVAERKDLEKALRKASPSSVLVEDSPAIQEAVQRIEEKSDLTVEELIGRASSVIAPEIVDKARQSIRQEINTLIEARAVALGTALVDQGWGGNRETGVFSHATHYGRDILMNTFQDRDGYAFGIQLQVQKSEEITAGVVYKKEIEHTIRDYMDVPAVNMVNTMVQKVKKLEMDQEQAELVDSVIVDRANMIVSDLESSGWTWDGDYFTNPDIPGVKLFHNPEQKNGNYVSWGFRLAGHDGFVDLTDDFAKMSADFVRETLTTALKSQMQPLQEQTEAVEREVQQPAVTENPENAENVVAIRPDLPDTEQENRWEKLHRIYKNETEALDEARIQLFDGYMEAGDRDAVRRLQQQVRERKSQAIQNVRDWENTIIQTLGISRGDPLFRKSSEGPEGRNYLAALDALSKAEEQLIVLLRHDQMLDKGLAYLWGFVADSSFDEIAKAGSWQAMQTPEFKENGADLLDSVISARASVLASELKSSGWNWGGVSFTHADMPGIKLFPDAEQKNGNNLSWGYRLTGPDGFVNVPDDFTKAPADFVLETLTIALNSPMQSRPGLTSSTPQPEDESEVRFTTARIIPTRAGVMAIPDDPEKPVYLAGQGEIKANSLSDDISHGEVPENGEHGETQGVQHMDENETADLLGADDADAGGFVELNEEDGADLIEAAQPDVVIAPMDRPRMQVPDMFSTLNEMELQPQFSNIHGVHPSGAIFKWEQDQHSAQVEISRTAMGEYTYRLSTRSPTGGVSGIGPYNLERQEWYPSLMDSLQAGREHLVDLLLTEHHREAHDRKPQTARTLQRLIEKTAQNPESDKRLVTDPEEEIFPDTRGHMEALLKVQEGEPETVIALQWGAWREKPIVRATLSRKEDQGIEARMVDDRGTVLNVATIDPLDLSAWNRFLQESVDALPLGMQRMVRNHPYGAGHEPQLEIRRPLHHSETPLPVPQWPADDAGDLPVESGPFPLGNMDRYATRVWDTGNGSRMVFAIGHGPDGYVSNLHEERHLSSMGGAPNVRKDRSHDSPVRATFAAAYADLVKAFRQHAKREAPFIQSMLADGRGNPDKYQDALLLIEAVRKELDGQPGEIVSVRGGVDEALLDRRDLEELVAVAVRPDFMQGSSFLQATHDAGKSSESWKLEGLRADGESLYLGSFGTWDRALQGIQTAMHHIAPQPAVVTPDVEATAEAVVEPTTEHQSLPGTLQTLRMTMLPIISPTPVTEVTTIGEQGVSGIYNGLDKTHSLICMDEKWYQHPLIDDWMNSGIFTASGWDGTREIVGNASNWRGKPFSLQRGVSDGELTRGEPVWKVQVDGKYVNTHYEKHLRVLQNVHRLAQQDAENLRDVGGQVTLDVRYKTAVESRFIASEQQALALEIDYLTDSENVNRTMKAWWMGADGKRVMDVQTEAEDAKQPANWITRARDCFAEWSAQSDTIVTALEKLENLYRQSAANIGDALLAVPMAPVEDQETLKTYRKATDAVYQSFDEEIRAQRKVLGTLGLEGYNERVRAIDDGEAGQAWRNASSQLVALQKEAEAQAKQETKNRGRRILDMLPDTDQPEEMALAIFMKHGIETQGTPPIVQAVQTRDVERIQSIIGWNSMNPASQEVFERMTGTKLGSSQKARMVEIDAWAGITPEERAQIDADKKAEKERQERVNEITAIWNAFAGMSGLHSETRQTVTGQEVLMSMAQAGYNRIQMREEPDSRGRMIAHPALYKPEGGEGRVLKHKDFRKLLTLLVQGEFDPEHRFVESLQAVGLLAAPENAAEQVAAPQVAETVPEEPETPAEPQVKTDIFKTMKDMGIENIRTAGDGDQWSSSGELPDGGTLHVYGSRDAGTQSIDLRGLPGKSPEAAYPVLKSLADAGFADKLHTAEIRMEDSVLSSGVQVERNRVLSKSDIERVIQLQGHKPLDVLATLTVDSETGNVAEMESAQSFLNGWKDRYEIPVAVTAIVDARDSGMDVPALHGYLDGLGADHVTVLPVDRIKNIPVADLVRESDLVMVLGEPLTQMAVSAFIDKTFKGEHKDLNKPTCVIAADGHIEMHRDALLEVADRRAKYKHMDNAKMDRAIAELAEKAPESAATNPAGVGETPIVQKSEQAETPALSPEAEVVTPVQETPIAEKPDGEAEFALVSPQEQEMANLPLESLERHPDEQPAEVLPEDQVIEPSPQAGDDLSEQEGLKAQEAETPTAEDWPDNDDTGVAAEIAATDEAERQQIVMDRIQALDWSALLAELSEQEKTASSPWDAAQCCAAAREYLKAHDPELWAEAIHFHFDVKDNPVQSPTITQRSGHDILGFADRAVVDVWAGMRLADKPFRFDFHDEKQLAYTAKLYGDPNRWEIVDLQVENQRGIALPQPTEAVSEREILMALHSIQISPQWPRIDAADAERWLARAVEVATREKSALGRMLERDWIPVTQEHADAVMGRERLGFLVTHALYASGSQMGDTLSQAGQAAMLRRMLLQDLPMMPNSDTLRGTLHEAAILVEVDDRKAGWTRVTQDYRLDLDEVLPEAIINWDALYIDSNQNYHIVDAKSPREIPDAVDEGYVAQLNLYGEGLRRVLEKQGVENPQIHLHLAFGSLADSLVKIVEVARDPEMVNHMIETVRSVTERAISGRKEARDLIPMDEAQRASVETYLEQYEARKVEADLLSKEIENLQMRLVQLQEGFEPVSWEDEHGDTLARMRFMAPTLRVSNSEEWSRLAASARIDIERYQRPEYDAAAMVEALKDAGRDPTPFEIGKTLDLPALKTAIKASGGIPDVEWTWKVELAQTKAAKLHREVLKETLQGDRVERPGLTYADTNEQARVLPDSRTVGETASKPVTADSFVDNGLSAEHGAVAVSAPADGLKNARPHTRKP